MTVILAFLANILVAVAKTIAAIITSSASMVAEAAHSWADAGNEVFLLIADRRGAKTKDARHPLGYGRNAFVWSLIAAFGIFTAGSIVSIMHGIQELSDTGPVESPMVAYVVLGVSFVLEGASFTQAMVKSRRLAKERGSSTWGFVLETSDTTLRAVFFEDSAALVGLAIAAGAIAMHQITGIAAWDAIGSILVGVLLGVVAIILIRRNIAFLVGATAAPKLHARVGAALLGLDDIERVTYLHIEYVGPNRLFIVAEIDLAGDAREHDVARRLRDVERRIEAHEAVETVVLSLSVDDEASLEFPGVSR
ncbi:MULTISPECIES: cation diffusion facilitator family transporter [unclassified Microbacterium]|uniref:cation diffusion facilitator family transporter n=1 Tax=unclassified Microbacterium TaxID=2609290 RepID=UPI0016052E47|nr:MULTISPECIES: cation diffusion facilitator family transporter [unclassified Microbacterium]QNA93882.1 cation diffusion facilitator family transporter [Microbacterium sp. Se63.02b]QYM64185.1 cation diffusion facilitator family transporter [Microbacterium sp. Se5.02b]